MAGTAADIVTSMEQFLKVFRTWGAPIVAVVFFVLWCLGEAGRMNGAFTNWSGAWPLIFITVAIGVSVWAPYASLAVTAALLAAQFFYILPAMAANHWAIYIGAFIALAFILWVSAPRTRLVAIGINVVFAAAMAVLMLSWRYGAGVGWYVSRGGDLPTFMAYGWQLFALLLLIAGSCAAIGFLLALLQERRAVFQARNAAQKELHEAEVNLMVEQERWRISRDLHDVLAHSLTVISAQADGIRYLNNDLPTSVVTALENIAHAARGALLDAQRVIEGGSDQDETVPQPQVKDIAPLVQGMRKSGLQIEESESGQAADLTTGQQIAIYRIVQESLTNALKHGGRDTQVKMHMDWNGPGLTLHVGSTLPSTDTVISGNEGQPRVGRGLPGMRERAHLAGGWVTAGPEEEHFRINAYVPYPAQGKHTNDGAQR